ncbi:hypothetical protein A2356_03310 [Candidatus Nomurabacteria bacterium RIFOXYB1_FULL_39_16]|uniref:Uncharacterized protein n=2 Tax=Candidatus Nomuraibacteriota TaxID=1752729 RepID=A0A0G0T9Z2_9BACT|nr:MAG: hypothetical protein UT78_C0001G0081 [Candidatus Nomurabacteria bacterium GW2011_GWF2_40_12]OGJ08823.1 MAG: hypothetical protein A2356_03310 [Candidatus Nomurabacteria bacterium RIFOXYB1_FULL_39_16]OGJ14960.1 MAG: hypothetical protein A2585_03630 [Candidatus Nomurabacteria bacterium RIFOXYD1_FULL_39_12]
MDGINKFNVPLDPEEVRKIQAGRKPQTEAPKKNITEEVSAMIDEIPLNESGKNTKEYHGVTIIGDEKILIKRQTEIYQLIDEILPQEIKKEARGEIPKKLLSILVTDDKATFISDYFDVIVHREYDFIKGEWGEELKTHKPEFNQSAQ